MLPLVVLLITVQAPLIVLLAFGVDVWWVDIFAHFLPWISLGFLLQAAVFRHRVLRVFSLAATTVAIGLIVTAPTAEMVVRPAVQCDGPQVRVLSFNVQRGQEHKVAVAPLLDEQRPDLAFFMEVTPEWDRVLSGLAADRGLEYHSDPDPGFYGSALMSRLPLAEIAFVPHAGSWAARRLAVTGDDLGTVPAGAPEMRAVVRLEDETFVLGGTHLSFPLAPSTHARALEETDQIAAWLRDRMSDQTIAGVLLVGDFNSTPFSAILRRLKADAGVTTVVPTWPGTWRADLPAGIAIDHMFPSGRLRIGSVEVGDNLGSDHKPVSARFTI